MRARAIARDLLGVALLLAGLVITAGSAASAWPGLFAQPIDDMVAAGAGIFLMFLGCDILNA